MNVLLAMISALSAIALTAAAVSVFVLTRAQRMRGNADVDNTPSPASNSSDIGELRSSLAALASQIREIQKDPPPAADPGAARPGLNLNRRSQALRMHRRGENVAQIASTLAVPRQEVELLVKVHRIVLSNVAS